MAASDKLAELAQRAKIAEDRVAAAKNQARADVQVQVATTRAAAQQKADELQAQKAERRAESAEDDAVAAVAFAEAALEEAEYAVLNATLARMDATAAG